MTRFANVDSAPLDSIMALDLAFRESEAKNKVNLVIGVFQNDEGCSPVLEVVKEAEKRLLETEKSKAYLPISGEAPFLHAAKSLVFEDKLLDRVSLVHTPGGTAALRISAEFIAEHFKDNTIWVSAPAYPNHKGIFSAVGMSCADYRYFSIDEGRVTFDQMLEDLSAAKAGDVVILHGCCHNPSGADLTQHQWCKIANFLAERDLIPFIDLAYLGYADGVAEDSFGVNTVFKACPNGFVSISFSKNFALYAERTGILAFVGETNEISHRCQTKSQAYIRSIYTSPPAHGARIVATVISDVTLHRKWLEEVGSMRDRLRRMRNALDRALVTEGVDMSAFPGLRDFNGMFALTKLTGKRADWLRSERGVFLLPNGRISIAGMRMETLDYLSDAFASALRQK